MPIKSLDDLSDEPLPKGVIFTPQAKAWKLQAERLLSESRYQFAEDTITRMLAWVVENGTVTANMQRALDNIEEGGNRGQKDWDSDAPRRGGSRRYEGWSR